VVKNKVAPPFKSASVDLIFGQGISKTGEIVDIASDLDIIQKSGAWYAYEGEKIGQGRENAKTFLDTNIEIKNKIEGLIRTHYDLT
jgi:recombination protein RecA